MVPSWVPLWAVPSTEGSHLTEDTPLYQGQPPNVAKSCLLTGLCWTPPAHPGPEVQNSWHTWLNSGQLRRASLTHELTAKLAKPLLITAPQFRFPLCSISLALVPYRMLLLRVLSNKSYTRSALSQSLCPRTPSERVREHVAILEGTHVQIVWILFRLP